MIAHWHTGAVSGLQEGLSSIVISNHFIALSDVFILFILMHSHSDIRLGRSIIIKQNVILA